MTTIVNNPPSNSSTGSVAGMMIGVAAAIIIVAVLFVYVLPYLNRNTSEVQVNVPEQINVDIETPNN